MIHSFATNLLRLALAVFAAALLILVTAPLSRAKNVSIDWVTIGDPGNFGGPQIDTAQGSFTWGAVPYEYRIGKYEVTNAQYVQFLNAKAASDPYGLYNTGMTINGSGGILRNGDAGSYTYSLKPGQENKPVNFVNFYDAARFTNWMNNGQGNADTETGAYTLVGGTAVPSNPNDIVRNPGATIVLPSADEWYKSAFYDPTKSIEDGEADYWLYPTQSDAISLITAPPSSTPHTANVFGTNFYGTEFGIGYALTPGVSTTNTALDYLTNVGAYTGSASHYGTYDQAGNVMEWTQEHTMLANPNGVRLILGGDFNTDEFSARYFGSAAAQGGSGGVDAGFRLVTLVVPEPSSILLAQSASVALLLFRRKVRRAS